MQGTSENFILNEEDMAQIRQTLENNGRTLERMVDSYNLLLVRIRMSALLEGKTAEKLNDLIERAKILNSHIENLSKRYGRLCDSLVQEVDQRDRYLY